MGAAVRAFGTPQLCGARLTAGCCSHACARFFAAKGELDCAAANPTPAKARTKNGAEVIKKRFEGMNNTRVLIIIDVALTFGARRPNKVLTSVYHMLKKARIDVF